jgi:hypothetical protein
VNRQIVSPGSHTYGATTCTIHGDGVTDDTACFQAAVNQGDVLVEPGKYALGGVYPNFITMPSNRNIRCDTGGNAAAGSVSFINTDNSQVHAWYMFYITGNTVNDTIFWCQFRGVNYNDPGAPLAQQFNGTGQYTVYIATLNPGNTNSSHVIAENDFNGLGGDVGTILATSSSASYTPPQNVTVEYNTAEHCGYRFVEIEAGNSDTITHNTESDCGDAIEALSTSYTFSNNTFSYNSYAWPHGTGAYIYYGYAGDNHLSENIACNNAYTSSPCDAEITVANHTNTFKYNRLSGAVGNRLLIGNSTCTGTSWTLIPAVNLSNVCGSNCTIYCGPGYMPGSDQ